MQPSVVKMSEPFISLCPEITRANALNLMDWLEDEDVIRYLTIRVDEHETGPSVMMRKNERDRKRREAREERD